MLGTRWCAPGEGSTWSQLKQWLIDSHTDATPVYRELADALAHIEAHSRYGHDVLQTKLELTGDPLKVYDLERIRAAS